VRRPCCFAPHLQDPLHHERIARLSSLLYFAQSLFLVFAAVYIAKESLEQVVLGAGAHDHSSGGGGHSHGQIPVEGDDR
jgi:hypothetical protein